MDNMFVYLEEIKKEPRCRLLTRKEEIKLAKLIKRGDEKARQRFILANLRLVVHIAKKYTNGLHNFKLIDIVQEGNIGLFEAVKRFEWKKGNFATYATYLIKYSITKGLTDSGNFIRIPIFRLKEIREIRLIDKKFLKKGIKLTPKQLCEKTGIPLVSVELVLEIIRRELVLSLDFFIDEEGKHNLADIVPNDLPPVCEESQIKELESQTKKSLQYLKRRERQVIILRFGFFGTTPCTLQQAGVILNLTGERVRQIEKKAKERIKLSKWGAHLKPFCSP